MPALREPEKITLVEGLTILQNYGGLSPEEAKTRLRQAFVRKAFGQAPLFAFPYDDADIDWTTGRVKIRQNRERFCPTFRRSDFMNYFFEGHTAVLDVGCKEVESAAPLIAPAIGENNAPAPVQRKEILTVKPGFMGVSIDLKELCRRIITWFKTRQ